MNPDIHGNLNIDIFQGFWKKQKAHDGLLPKLVHAHVLVHHTIYEITNAYKTSAMF